MKIPCPKCGGSRKVDSIDGLPWSMANNEPHKREEVRSGKRFHIPCDKCQEAGEIEATKE